MTLWRKFIVGERAGPSVPRTHLCFLRIVRWHGPTAEERVARGPQQGVPKLGAMWTIAFL